MWNPESWALESGKQLKKSESHNDWNRESNFHWQRLECNAWNPESRRGFQNPRLAWIPLPWGDSQVYKLNIPNRNSVLYYVEKLSFFYRHVTIRICGSVILHLSHVIHCYRLWKVATPSLRAIRWFATKHGVHGSGATSFCVTLAILVSFFCGYFICNKVATEANLFRKNWNLAIDNVTSVLDSPGSWYVNESTLFFFYYLL